MSEEEVTTQNDVENSSQNKIDHHRMDDHGITQQFLTFTVGGEEYGVEITKIREIKGWAETTRLPNSPSFMKGVINLRGLVIPIFDLRGRFSMGTTEPTEKNVVIIIALEERLVGVLVDTVSDILSVDSNDIRPAPQIETDLDVEFIDGLISIKDKMVVLLNVNNLFDAETMQDVTKALGEKG
ncbi:chemotaxis protein CheW [Rickettsiales bacterium]|nr:chemotaxis protein CheW [Rickettsiales bacterium]